MIIGVGLAEVVRTKLWARVRLLLGKVVNSDGRSGIRGHAIKWNRGYYTGV